MVLLVTTLRRS